MMEMKRLHTGEIIAETILLYTIIKKIIICNSDTTKRLLEYSL